MTPEEKLFPGPVGRLCSRIATQARASDLTAGPMKEPITGEERQ